MTIDYSNPTLVAGIVAVALLLIVGLAIAVRHRSEQTKRLRMHFGPEYDLVLQNCQTRREAERRLLDREKRVRLLKIQELTQAQRAQCIAAWEGIQSRFIDHPRGAVIEADELVTSLLQASGLPVERFEQRVADISVDHPHLTVPYRAANAIAVRAGKNDATTEELRTAMLHYRTLVDDLLQIETPVGQGERALRERVVA